MSVGTNSGLRVSQVGHSNVEADPRIVRSANALRAAGYTISMHGGGSGLPIRPMTPWRKVLTALRLAPVRLMPPLLARPVYWTLPENRRLYRLIVDARPDIIHAHDWDSLPAASRAAKKLGARLIYDCHEHSVGRRRHRLLWRAFFPPYIRALEARHIGSADAVVTISEGLSQQLREEYGLRTPPHVVRSATDLAPMPFRVPDAQKIIVHYHGILTQGRGLRKLVESVRQWPDRYRLRLTGWGQPSAFEKELGALVERLGLRERVEFIPKIPYDMLVAHAHEADIGICFWDAATPQRDFALPNKAFEYLAAGLMLIVGPCADLRCLVDDTKAGITLPDNNPETLSRSLAALPPEQIARHKRNAAEAAHRLGWQKEAEKLLALYERLTPHLECRSNTAPLTATEPAESPGSSTMIQKHSDAADLSAPVSAGSDKEPVLAFEYLAGFVRWLADSDHTVITYDDLAETITHGEEQRELLTWCSRALARGENGILLQYDVDARPDLTMRLLDVHRDHGVPANVMIFNKRLLEDAWPADGGEPLVDLNYRPEFSSLEAFQRAGGVIGYHCNAFDRSGGDMARATEIFHQDVAELRKHLDIRFFSMHGGIVTSDGDCNASMPIAEELSALGLTWVHNGHTVHFHQTWSDGGAAEEDYRKECTDPLDFLCATNIGTRSRLIFHPQYYCDLESRRFDLPVLENYRWVRSTRRAMGAGIDGRRFWAARNSEALESINRFKVLFEPTDGEEPVFVHGVSRSGTTLLVSMFDAHPHGAMAYESYPSYLYRPDGPVIAKEDYIHVYQTLMNCAENDAFNLLDRDPLKGLRLFAAVTSWTGMTVAETGELLRAFLVDKHQVLSVEDALNIIAASARFKVRQMGARFWGTKCEGNFDDYFALWPNACLVYILRHGLDVLASQKTQGAFNPDPETLGRNWRDQYHNFMAYWSRNPDKRIAFVRYEQLVAAAEDTAKRMCAALNFPYHPQMIRQHEKETTLTRNPRGQLSAERVREPIDTSSLERWRTTLTTEEVDAFLRGAGEPIFLEHDFEWR
jgi:glycosyltransferase involved in cell wall biosynthesis